MLFFTRGGGKRGSFGVGRATAPSRAVAGGRPAGNKTRFITDAYEPTWNTAVAVRWNHDQRDKILFSNQSLVLAGLRKQRLYPLFRMHGRDHFTSSTQGLGGRMHGVGLLTACTIRSLREREAARASMSTLHTTAPLVNEIQQKN